MLTKTYTKDPICLERLIQEINASAITIALDLTTTSVLGTDVTLTFKIDLTEGEWTICDSVVDSHTGEQMPDDYVQKISGEVTPTAPKNEYNLRPYGLAHKHIDSSEQIFDITLSNKNEFDIEYSNCSATPEFYDCIFQDHSEIRDGVSSVSGSMITSFMGRLQEGEAKLSKAVNIDYKIEVEEDIDYVYLWGVFVDAEGYGEDDMARLQIVDRDGVGVDLGLYDQDTFDYLCSIQGGVFILKEYDECWIRHISKLTEIDTPDGSPGEIPVGMVLRLKYYPKDITKTNIRVWKDYKITIKD